MEATPAIVEASAAGDPAAASGFRFYSDLMAASFVNKKQSNPCNQSVQGSFTHQSAGGHPSVNFPTSTPGVSNCYVFKSRLQEFAQKVGLPTPVYETIKEGPSHEPSFRSTVIVNGVRYDSLQGFYNRKAAEQSAAEIALVELSKCGDKEEPISLPVHETGLCKNLLQEYAQKMNYAIPTYICRKDDTAGRAQLFSCTVEIGGIQYIGATAKTKKDAEIKAARTALLAIRSNPSENFSGKTQYTVVPCKRKVSETAPPQVETVKQPKKPKRPHFKKRPRKQRSPADVSEQTRTGDKGILVNNMGAEVAVEHFQNGMSNVQVPDNIQTSNSLATTPQENGSVAEVRLSHDSSQLAVSSCQKLGNGNRLATNSDLPASRQSGALVSESEIGPGEPAPGIEGTNRAIEENRIGGNEE